MPDKQCVNLQKWVITVTKEVVCVCVSTLQVQEPVTDRQLIETSPVLQKLTDFETAIGVLFTHVRLLARAFTLRTVGFNHLTLYVWSVSRVRVQHETIRHLMT